MSIRINRALYARAIQGAALFAFLLASGCAANKSPQSKPQAFWPPYPNEPRLQFLCSFQTSADVAPPKSGLDKLIYGKESEQVLAINKPYGVKMWNGRVYVCDLRNAGVIVFDLRNRQTLVMGRNDPVKLLGPSDIAIAPDGMKYVADSRQSMIFVYDAADRFVRTMGHKDFKPAGIAVFGNELFICDLEKQRVEVMDRNTGSVLRTFGEAGMEPGQFIQPVGIAVDAQGFVYVSDVLKCTIQKFDRGGQLVASISGISPTAGGLVRPKQIAVDPDGVIFVVDAAFQNVQLLNQQGQPLTYFGGPGGHPGSMSLPVGICLHDGDLDIFKDYINPAFDAQRLVVVTNQYGANTVAIYAFGQLRPGKTVADISNSKGLVPETTTEKAPTAGPGAPLPTTAPSDFDSPTTKPSGLDAVR